MKGAATTTGFLVAQFTVGAGAFGYELLTGGDRPYILGIAGALMGLPFVLSADLKRMRSSAAKLIEGEGKPKEDDEERWSHLP